MNVMLSEEQVRDVQALLRQGVAKQRIARRLGVSRTSVKRVAAEVAGKTASQAPPGGARRCGGCGGLVYGDRCRACETTARPDCRKPEKGDESADLSLKLGPGPRGRWLRLRRKKQREEAARALSVETATPPARRVCEADWTEADQARLVQLTTAVAIAAAPPIAAAVWLCGFAVDREETFSRRVQP